ncbi:MAG: AAA family ATPase [Candidatus Bathyarchaeota archaeon]
MTFASILDFLALKECVGLNYLIGILCITGGLELLIREIILENFMSYEYARIPLKPGLNLVCGPNGSGKSSILLAISVALGQTSTERSRKLSDLIRWGKDIGRVTLTFDNTIINGRRPVATFDVDYFRISRYLKKDGNYWFEANFRPANKSDITNVLNNFGLDPDNMLIIMQQNTMEEFGITSPSQKLVMFEEAIGLAKHRMNILDAQERLVKVLSEEESIKTLLTSSEQTLAYWRSEYERYQRRKELLVRKGVLDREFIWAQVERQESLLESWRGKVKKKETEILEFGKELEENSKLITALHGSLNGSRFEQRKLFYSLIDMEKENTEHKVIINVQTKTLEKLANLKASSKALKSIPVFPQEFQDFISVLNTQIASSLSRLKEVEDRISQTQIELSSIEDKILSITERYLEARVNEGLQGFQRKIAKDELEKLDIEVRSSQRELEALKSFLDRAGPRIDTQRSPSEVSEEIKIINSQLMSLGDVSRDVEKMYSSYLTLYNELKNKAIIVSENRTHALNEIDDRKTTWKKLIQPTLDEVNITYQKFLSRISARGSLRLINTTDLETAGLELIVGFKGAEPKILDSYTQSGGERSAATMAFLLALQQHVKSPFRAIDEFDVHMDPRNREVISDMLLGEMSGSQETQYLTITPGQLTTIEKDVHIITVQNISGKSEIKVTI